MARMIFSMFSFSLYVGMMMMLSLFSIIGWIDIVCKDNAFYLKGRKDEDKKSFNPMGFSLFLLVGVPQIPY